MSITLNAQASSCAKLAYPQALDEDYADSGSPRDVGRLDASKQVTEILSKQPERLTRPTPAQSMVTSLQANQALNRIMARADGTLEKGARLALSNIETVSMDSMMLATMLLTGKVMGDTAESKCKALEIMSGKQESIRNQQIKEYCEQLDKAVEQQQQAKKSGIIGVVFDWVVAAVEIGIGVVKLACGNPTGVLDIAAGISGAFKALANTLALIDPAHASLYGKIADVAGKIQLVLEVVSMAVDMLSAAVRGLAKVATHCVRQAGTFVEKAGALLKSVGSLIKRAAVGLAKKTWAALQKIGNTILNMGKYLRKAGAYIKRKAMEFMQKLSSLSEAGIGGALKKLGESFKSIVDSIKKFAQRLKTDKEFLLKVLQETRHVVHASGEITSGVFQLERAKLQKQIDTLILEQQWLQICFDFYEKGKKTAMKQIQDLLETQSNVMEEGSKLINRTTTLQAHVAASMV